MWLSELEHDMLVWVPYHPLAHPHWMLQCKVLRWSAEIAVLDHPSTQPFTRTIGSLSRNPTVILPANQEGSDVRFIGYNDTVDGPRELRATSGS